MCVVTLACIRFRSPCEDAATRIEDKKAGARKTTVELEEELMKKYAEGARKVVCAGVLWARMCVQGYRPGGSVTLHFCHVCPSG